MLSHSRTQMLAEIAAGKSGRGSRHRQSVGPTESQIQASFFEWLTYIEAKEPLVGLFYAIPNGTNKSITARMVHKATGLKSGVPDTHLPLPANGKNGLWIEFKSKRGSVSDNQWIWITKLRLAGHQVEICRSWEQAANIVIDYLGLNIQKLGERATN